MSFGVDLDDQCFPGHVLSGARNLRRRGAARSTPCCPKVDQYRNLSVLSDFVEENWIRCERFCDRREFGLTGATAACVGKVSGGDTVLLVALSTSSYDWHDGPLSEY